MGKLRTLPRPSSMKGREPWDEVSVQEASSIRARARQSGRTVRFARIAELCYEEGSELNEDAPQRKMAGRRVLLGDVFINQDFNWADVAELGSSPPIYDSCRSSRCNGKSAWAHR